MSKIKISILCPTAKRPKELRNMITSALNQSSNPKEIEFCLYLDRGDDSYNKLMNNFSRINVKIIRGPKMWLSTMYNCLLVISSGNIIMWGGDDVVFLTPKWDQKVISKFNSLSDSLRMVFVNDLTNGAGIWANIGFVHKSWIDFFGYLFTPHMPDNGIDSWITSVTKKLNRAHYLNDVVIEHRQYRQGKSDIDSTYLQRLEKHKMYNPLFLYKSLDEEKRRDLLMLSVKADNRYVPFDYKFIFSFIFLKIIMLFKFFPVRDETLIYLGAMKNWSFLKLVLRKIGIPLGPKSWY